MKAFKHVSLTFLVFVTVVAAIGLAPVVYGKETVVYVSYPSPKIAKPGETFEIEVRIANAKGVFAWEIHLRWNASVLNVTSFEEGGFLKGLEEVDTYFVNVTEFDQIGNDSISLACTRLGAIPGVDGTGVLAKITFLVRTEGETPLDLFDTKLRDSNIQPIPHTAIGEYFPPRFPQPFFTFTPRVADINETVTFDASESFDPDGYIVAYYWDFGDGTTANGTQPFPYYHAYRAGGEYWVSLTVVDDTGSNNTGAERLWVRFPHDIRVFLVSLSDTEVTAGEIVTVTVVVGNTGAESESGIEVVIFYEPLDKRIGSQTISVLNPGQNKTVTFTWDTSEVPEGTYRVKAVASPVLDETYVADNTERSKYTITVTAAAGSLWASPWVWGGSLAAAVVVSLGILFMVRRKGGSS
jgi:PKD repeat protein